MSKIDQARKLGAELAAATDRLNAGLAAVQQALVDLNLGVEVGIKIPPETAEQELWFAKKETTWELQVRGPNGRTPLKSAARKVRILAAGRLPALLEAMIAATSDTYNQVRMAETDIELALDMIDNRGDCKGDER